MLGRTRWVRRSTASRRRYVWGWPDRFGRHSVSLTGTCHESTLCASARLPPHSRPRRTHAAPYPPKGRRHGGPAGARAGRTRLRHERDGFPSAHSFDRHPGRGDRPVPDPRPLHRRRPHRPAPYGRLDRRGRRPHRRGQRRHHAGQEAQGARLPADGPARAPGPLAARYRGEPDGLPLGGLEVPQLRRGDGGDQPARRAVPRDREQAGDRKVVPGSGHVRHQDQRQRRDGRGRARGALHRPPARARAPDRRDGPLPAQGVHLQVRQRLPGHGRRQRPRDLDRAGPQPGRRRVRHRHRLLPLLAQEPAAGTPAPRTSARTRTATGTTSSAAAAAPAAARAPRPTGARPPSRRPR